MSVWVVHSMPSQRQHSRKLSLPMAPPCGLCCYPCLFCDIPYKPARWKHGSHREWAEIAGELHKQGLFWIVADIITQLVPAGRVAVEAHNAICEYLGPEYVSPHLTFCL